MYSHKLVAMLQCTGCNQNYKIVTQELDFYKQQGLPVPKYCPACRQQQRMAMRPQRELWQRQCMCTQPDHAHGTQQCDAEFSTAYSPNDKALVFCELCYQKEIY